MKYLFILFMAFSLSLYSCQPAETEESTETAEENPVHDGIRWSGDDEVANYLANAGRNHFSNVEFDKAYTMNEHAVMVDESLFATQTLLAMTSRGEKREYHKALAKKYVVNENETCKLFVSLLDVQNDSTGEQRRAIWAKMHEMSNGPWIHHMYARSLQDPMEVAAEMDNVIAFMEELGASAAASYNIKGYSLQRAGDLEGGTAAIDKYVELYPEGYNPIDSRAEFYLFAGDTATAIEWYRKVIQKYPFAQAARNHLEELDPRD